MVTQRFRNDTERAAFLDNYREESAGWYLWKEDPELGEKIWRNDLSDTHYYAVREVFETSLWPKKHQKWYAIDRYIVDLGDPEEEFPPTFHDQRASRTQQLTDLKEFQKKEKSR